MPLEVRPVRSKTDLKRFLKLAYPIYRDYPHWVPPLEFERLRFLDPAINPWFKNAEIEHFIAYDSSSNPVGRISAFIDRASNATHNESTGGFGMFESVNDRKVSDLILDTAYNWCRERGMERIRGPLNFSLNHECGLLVEGFEHDPCVGMTYNPPYYESLLVDWGLSQEKDLLSLCITNPTQVPDYMSRAAAKLTRRGRFEIRTFRKNRIQEELEHMWEIYNSAWVDNWAHVPMEHDEFLFAAENMKSLLIPELCFFAEVKGEPAGFALTLPNHNRALKKMKGKLFPFGWFHFLKDGKDTHVVRTITLGVKKKFRRLGIDLLFYHLTYSWGIENGSYMMDQSWVLEDNLAMVEPIKRLGGAIYKRHRLYERKI